MSGFLVLCGRARADHDLRAVAEDALRPRDSGGVRYTETSLGGIPVQLADARREDAAGPDAPCAPLRSASGRSCLAWSGALYNSGALAAALGPPPGGWRTQSDGEVLLEGLERCGPAFLARTAGDFALAFVRSDPPQVLVARDRLGVRPLYAAQIGSDAWAAGSTVRGVLAAGRMALDLDRDALESYLLFGAVYEPRTIAQRVRAVAPGSWRRFVPQHGWSEERWWHMPEPSGELSLAQGAEPARAALIDAITERIPARGRLGMFVSGGTDSSSLAMLTAETCPRRFSSFSASFIGDDAAFSEERYQRQVAERCGSEHHPIVIGLDDARLELDGYFERMDQPTLDGFNVHFAARAARAAGVDVCFSGDGGDEVFAGYRPFRTLERYQALLGLLAPLPRGLRHGLALPFAWADRLLPLESRLIKSAHLLRHAHDLSDYWVTRRAVFLQAQIERLQGTVRPRLAEWLSFVPPPSADLVTRWSAYEIGNYVLNTLARDADVFSGGNGVELRCPYLDHRLIELVFRVRGAEKVGALAHKPLLQALMRDALPHFTWGRPKMGFTLPLQNWLQRDLLPAPDLSPWLDGKAVQHIIDGFRRNPGNGRSWVRLWSLNVLECWLRRHAVSRG